MNIINPEKHDVIFLSECWFSNNTQINLNGFQCYKKARPRRKRAKRDSGGLCVFIKNSISNLFHFIEWNNEDGMLFKILNNHTYSLKNIYMFFCYMRPDSSSRNDLISDFDVFDTLSNKVCDLRKDNEIIVIGDLNSRCGTLKDFIISIDSNFDPIESDVFNEFCITENDLLSANIPALRNNEDKKLNDFGHKLINLCQLSGLLICNGRLRGDENGNFTYIDKKGRSSNDFALISKGLINSRHEFYVNNITAYSDHCPIVLNLSQFFCHPATTQPSVHTTESPMYNKCNLFTSYNFDSNSASQFIENMNDDYVYSNLNAILELTNFNDNYLNIDVIDSCIESLNSVLEYAAKPFEKKCNNFNVISNSCNNQSYAYAKDNNNPWYDNECKNKRKEFDAARKIYFNSLQQNDLHSMCNIRNEYRKLCRLKKKNFNYQSAKNLVHLSKTNSKMFWKKVKRKQRKCNASCDFTTYFKDLFETPFSDLNDNTHALIDNVNNDIISDDFLDAEITLDELEQAIKKLKNDKSPGFDNIINEFLKLNTPLFKNTLLSIFNVLFKQGYFPKAWSVGLIIPIFKKGDHNLPENYRGITLLSCVGKLFTSLLNQRLNNWAEQNHKYDVNQYGFRDGKSTIDAMFVLQNIIDVFLSNNNALFVSFIDLKKAFDCTSHKALWYKLHMNEISSKITVLLKNMYSIMKLAVKDSLSNINDLIPCNCNTSSKKTCCLTCNAQVLEPFLFSPHAGVFQGESLSPTLFSFFLNDINDYMKEDPTLGINIFHFYIALLLFADDMVLFSSNRFGLQAGLDRLLQYCNNWGLVVNVEKTKCLVFKKGGRKSILDKWYYDGFELETVTSFKYLGFVFASTGTFSQGIEHVSFQGKRALFNLFSSIENFDSMYVNMQLSMFHSLVVPVLCYASEIWGFAEAKKVETVHLKFLKMILKVKKTTPSCIVYKELNVYPLYLTRLFRVINFWLKIIKLKDDDALKMLYLSSLIIHDNTPINNTPSCWAHHVRKILYLNGFGYIWENQHLGIDKSFSVIFKNRIVDSFWQTNSSDIDSLSANRLYRHLQTEKALYLSNLQNDFIRVAITKLRLGSHNLFIERGRWNNTNYLDRKCLQCNDIEDEYHFVLICSKYNDLRIKYIPKTYFTKPSMYKFLNLINNGNDRVLKNLGLFLHHAFKRYTANEILI